MKQLKLAEYESALDAHLLSRNSAAVVELILRDPRHRFARGFNKHMIRVDADDIEVVYFSPLFVLARLLELEARKIPDTDTLFKLLWGIQQRVGRKSGAKADRRANPRIKVRRRPRDRGSPPASQPLFAPDGGNLELQPGRECDPTFGLLRRELFKDLLNAVRHMGRIPLRVFREVQSIAARRGGHYGAFQAVAQRAKLDSAGRVVAILPDHPNGHANEKPSPRTIHQVREFYKSAVDFLNGGGWWQGPSGL